MPQLLDIRHQRFQKLHDKQIKGFHYKVIVEFTDVKLRKSLP